MTKLKHVLKISAALFPFAFSSLVSSQTQATATPPPVPDIQTLQQITTQNASQLHAYQWIETTTTTTTAQGQSTSQRAVCRFAPDGTLTKTPLDPQQNSAQQNSAQQMKGGLLMQMMAKKRMGQAGQAGNEIAQVNELASMYLPLNPDKLTEAAQAGDGTNGSAVILNDYAKPGDQVQLSLDSTMQTIKGMTVKSYLTAPEEDPLSISTQFSKLGDGTTYPSVTTIKAPSKQISITTLSSDFSKPVQ
jgi:hypothetical protein